MAALYCSASAFIRIRAEMASAIGDRIVLVVAVYMVTSREKKEFGQTVARIIATDLNGR
jgi:hypothetical protein